LVLAEVIQVMYLLLLVLEDQIQFLTQAVLKELLKLLLKVVVLMFNPMVLMQTEDQVLDVMVGMAILEAQETHLLLVHLKEMMVVLLDHKQQAVAVAEPQQLEMQEAAVPEEMAVTE